MTDTWETETMRLVPYARGVYGRDTLYHVWRLMEDEQMAQQIFYSQQCTDERWRGDLVECVGYFSCQSPPRMLVLPQDKISEEIMGLVWFDHMGHVGTMGLCYRKRFRGKHGQAATALACQYAFATFSFTRVFGFTPYKEAVAHVRALGWTRVGHLPGFVRINGQDRHLYQMMLTKE